MSSPSRFAPGSWPRTALMLVCAVLAVISSVVAVICATAAATVRDPDFYAAHLAEHGVFARLDDELVPVWVEARLNAQFPGIEDAITKEAAALAGDTLSRSWFAERTDQAAHAMIPWLDGRQEGFATRFTVADRVAVAGEMLAARLPRSTLARRAYDAAMREAVDRIVREESRMLPLGLSVSRETWLEVISTAAPLDWVASQVGAQLEKLVAYLIGEAPHFSIAIPLHEQQDDLAAAINVLVDDSNVSQFIKERVLSPALRENVESAFMVEAIDIELSREEIIAAFESALTSQWLEEREKDIAAALAAYLTGETEALVVDVPLAPLKAFAAEKLAQTVDEKLERWFATLPECSQLELAGYLIGTQTDIRCRPPGLGFERAKRLLGIDVESRVRAHLDERMPDAWTHDEVRMREYVSEEVWGLVEQARDVLQHGLSVDRERIDAALARYGAGPDALERARELVTDGWVLDDARLRDALERARGQEALDELDAARRALTRTRIWLLPSLAVALGSLLGLLLLARPERRLLGPGLGLTLAALCVLLTSAWLRGRLEAFNAGLLESAVVEDRATTLAYLVESAPDVLASMTNDVVATVQWSGGVALALGLVLIAVGALHGRDVAAGSASRRARGAG